MIYMFNTGSNSLKDNVLTWQIPNFFTLPVSVDCEIRTSEFVFANRRFTLAIWPRGQKAFDTEGWFGIGLYKYNAPSYIDPIEFSIVKNGVDVKSCRIECSEGGNYRNDKFIEWSELLSRRYELAPGGCLTMTCRMARRCDTELGVDALKEISTSGTDVKEYGRDNLLKNSRMNDGTCPDTSSIKIGTVPNEFQRTQSYDDFKFGDRPIIKTFGSSDSMPFGRTYEALSKLSEYEPTIYLDKPTKKELCGRILDCYAHDISVLCRKSTCIEEDVISKPSEIFESTDLNTFINNSSTKASESVITSTSITSEASGSSDVQNTSGSTLSDTTISSNSFVSKEEIISCPTCLERNSETVDSAIKKAIEEHSFVLVSTSTGTSPGDISGFGPVSFEASELSSAADETQPSGRVESKIPVRMFFITAAKADSKDFEKDFKNEASNTTDAKEIRKTKDVCVDASTQTEKDLGDGVNCDAAKKDLAKSCTGCNHISEDEVAQVPRDLKHFEKLSRDYEKLYLEDKCFDLVIKIKDSEFRAHRAFLRARSPTFAELLSQTDDESTNNILSMDGDPETFDDFLRYIYSGKLQNLSEDNMCGLYCTAHLHDLPELKQECIELMKKSMSTETICDIIHLATKYNEVELLKLATVFFAKNLKEILDTEKWTQFLLENTLQATKLYRDALDIGYIKRTD